MATLTRARLVAALKKALESKSHVQAAWLGGSDAFSRLDGYSDIDLNCLGPEKRAKETFSAVERAMKRLSPIALQYDVPSPTPQGYHQRLYQLRDAGEWLMVDFCYLPPDVARIYLEPRRHGIPPVLFDRGGHLKPAPLDAAGHRDRMRLRLKTLRVTFPLFQPLVKKAVMRGDPVEAAAHYQSMTMRPLIEVLRMRHCPVRFDYGPRYTRIDLPPAVSRLLAGLLYPRDAGDLLRKRKRAERIFAETLAAIDVEGFAL